MVIVVPFITKNNNIQTKTIDSKEERQTGTNVCVYVSSCNPCLYVTECLEKLSSLLVQWTFYDLMPWIQPHPRLFGNIFSWNVTLCDVLNLHSLFTTLRLWLGQSCGVYCIDSWATQQAIANRTINFRDLFNFDL